MGLGLYKKKRKFTDTPEPEGKAKSSKPKLIFVVQRHKASHLHYDFRLEMEGVLKSWAVPKGPSLNPADKRLAMMVEDHPYDYKDFEGVIPEGNYGAGIVEIWDKGTYADLDNSPRKDAEKILLEGLKAGSLKFTLFGKKLKGEFALVKMKGREENSWLLIKHNDEYATDEPYNSEDETPASSPINKELKTHKSPRKRASGMAPMQQGSKFTDYIPAMLAKETSEPFDNNNWIFEIKWDGYRAIAELNKGAVKLYSRNGLNFAGAYPPVFDALQKIKKNMVIDGEIVVLNDNGFPDFQLLQHYDGNRHRPIQYQVFDILFLNGKDLCSLPLTERKEILRKELPQNDVIKYSDHVAANGLSFFEVTREQGLEGMMAKRADSSYYPGKRTADWLKVKHNQTQEAVIGGYTPPSGGRKFFGSLVLGMMDEQGKLRYIGNSGSGFNYQSLKELYERMQPLVQDTSPFNEKVKEQKYVTWVKPSLVCEIKFTEVTKDGKLRHPIFMHIREDKSAKEVTTANTASAEPPKKKAVPPKKVREKKETKDDDGGKVFLFGNNKVKASNVTKVYFPEDGVTKGDVIDYYISMSKYILPYLKGRPESLLRNPNGIHAKGFFQKDAGEDTPPFVKSQKIYSESVNKDIDYIICDNQATLTYLNNLGCIEINPWHSTLKALDCPDYLIIDIDPSEKNTFEQVVDAALVVKEILDKAGAQGFCKTSGSSGLHIYVPTAKKYTYEQVKDFAYLVCMLAEQQIPSFTTLERNLQKRRNDRIYMDYLQNRRGQTIACAYSLRPKPGATVACPLDWKEVKSGLSPKQFTIHNILERVQKKGDLFTGILGKGIDLNKCLKKLGA